MASYYWVGDSVSGDVWPNANAWANISGGPGGAGIPQAAVDVVFDNLSSRDCTIPDNYSGTCKSLTSNGYSHILNLPTSTIGQTSFTSVGGISVDSNAHWVMNNTFTAKANVIIDADATIDGSLKAFWAIPDLAPCSLSVPGRIWDEILVGTGASLGFVQLGADLSVKSLEFQSGSFASAGSDIDVYTDIQTIVSCGGIDFTDSVITLHDGASISDEFDKITKFPDRINSVCSGGGGGGPVDSALLHFNLKSFEGVAAYEKWLQDNIPSGGIIKSVWYAEAMQVQMVMWETGDGGGAG